MARPMLLRTARRAAAALLLALSASLAQSATITIVNNDGAGEGFNDPTAAAPVGGNPGTTVGDQRLYVFQYAADIWGGLLPSNVEIRINAQFNPLSCTATSGVLGSAGPTTVHRDFAGAPLAGHWDHQALANRLAGSDLAVGTNDINTTFNSGVGTTGCLEVGWYYGVDGNEGGQIELLPVVLHELGHGLGFSTTTSGSSGAYASGFPHVYDHFLYDNVTGLHWDAMTSGQRATSAISCDELAWDGPNSIAHAPFRLGPKPLLRVNTPAGIAGDYSVGLPTFGPGLDATGVTGDVVLVNDGVGTVTDGCEVFGGVAGKIALIDRGTCTFTVKVKNAQDAGAIGVIVADNAAGCPPAGMGGTDPTITIPSVRITQADGAILKANLGGLNATLRVDPALMSGADGGNRPLMYAPNPYQSGSSVSHWDTSAEPNLLMEPAITSSVSSDPDLAFALMADIGWFQGYAGVGGPRAEATRLGPSVPNPAPGSAAIHYTLAREQRVELAIYDLAGRQVTLLLDGRVPAGSHPVTWDGRDRSGRPAPAGVYLYRLRTQGTSEAKHLVITR